MRVGLRSEALVALPTFQAPGPQGAPAGNGGVTLKAAFELSLP